MKLTGKCKEDFEKWYIKQGLNFNVVTDVEGNKDTYYFPISYFNDYPKSMQYGVYVDFFDSVGINIEITNDNKHIKTFWVDVNAKETDDIELNSRSEARTAAIEKANEIYNGK